jgi:hypothetical protein
MTRGRLYNLCQESFVQWHIIQSVYTEIFHSDPFQASLLLVPRPFEGIDHLLINLIDTQDCSRYTTFY